MAPVSPKREDLVVPYVHVPPAAPSQPSAVISQSMPMAAMFMKNKLLSWFSVFTAVQTILNEPKTPAASDSGAQSPLIRFLMAFFGLAVCYMDLAFPGSSGPVKRRKAVEEVVEGISSTIATAVASATN